MLGRAISLVESSRPEDRALAGALVARCHALQPDSYRIGITGVPGVGKSTFIDQFGMYLIEQGHHIAVLAVDPSSPKSGGSILGDKTRMAHLSHHPAAFVRPSPSRGTLGGVSQRTRELTLLCEAAGYDIIFIETVGVGQSEVAVKEMVDFFLLLMLPNAGDELQGIKKGVIEMADMMVINKADGDHLPAARTARAQYSQALRIFPGQHYFWKTPVLLCSALEGMGFQEIWEQMGQYQSHAKDSSFWSSNRGKQRLSLMQTHLQQLILESLSRQEAWDEMSRATSEAVLAGGKDPFSAAQELFQSWLSAQSK